jgi:hypothetical protein
MLAVRDAETGKEKDNFFDLARTWTQAALQEQIFDHISPAELAVEPNDGGLDAPASMALSGPCDRGQANPAQRNMPA